MPDLVILETSPDPFASQLCPDRRPQWVHLARRAAGRPDRVSRDNMSNAGHNLCSGQGVTMPRAESGSLRSLQIHGGLRFGGTLYCNKFRPYRR